MATTQNQSTKEDILDYLLKQGQTTAQSLAERFEISPQAVRRHLKDLEEEGLIQHQTVHAAMGRPQHTYELSQKGRDRLPDRYDTFALSLLDTLAETVGKDQMKDILRMQWQRKALEYRQKVGAGSLQERVARLVALRQAEGYMAEWHPLETEEAAVAQRYVITEYNCAIAQIAETFPSVCGHELEMFALALENSAVERTHWLVNGEHRCGYLVQQIGD